MTYNGWTNYETWLVNIWMDNDGHDSHEIIGDLTDGENLPDVATVSNWIKEQIEERREMLEISDGLLSDLLGGAIQSVNFDEIARHWLEDYEA